MKHYCNQFSHQCTHNWRKDPKVTVSLLITLFFIVLTILAVFQHLVWRPALQLLKPTTLVSPIKLDAYAETIDIAGYSATPVFTPAEQAHILSYKHGDILWRIYTLESSRGVNGFLYCEKIGERNDFGMGVLNTPPMCFQTLDDELSYVSNWFDKHLQTMTLSESLCTYNVGIKEDSCEYARNFMNL